MIKIMIYNIIIYILYWHIVICECEYIISNYNNTLIVLIAKLVFNGINDNTV